MIPTVVSDNDKMENKITNKQEHNPVIISGEILYKAEYIV